MGVEFYVFELKRHLTVFSELRQEHFSLVLVKLIREKGVSFSKSSIIQCLVGITSGGM